jgi:hypothetical protein
VKGEAGKLKGLKPAGAWNRLRATLKGETLKMTLNGRLFVELDDAKMPPKGPFALRPEGAMNFGNLFVRQLGK